MRAPESTAAAASVSASVPYSPWVASRPLRQELAHDAAPLLLAEVGADAPGREGIVTVLAYAGSLLAAEDVDEVAGAELLPALALEAHDGGHELLRRDRAVPCGRRFEAGVAVAARFARLAEVGEQVLAAALHGLAEREHGVEVLRQTTSVREIAGTLVDHAALLHHVLETVGEPRRRGQPVAAGTPRLLVVALDRFRQVDMGDEADVGLVDAHSERDRRDDHDAVFAEEALLRAATHTGVEARVVRHGVDAVGDEERRKLLGGRAGERVDDARHRFARGIPPLAAHEVEQLPAHVDLGRDAVLDVGTIEARHEVPRAVEREPCGDLAVRRLGGGGRERDARHVGPALGELRQREVVGAEVVTPLGDAVRLVDREEGDAPLFEEALDRLGIEPLWRDVEQVELAREVGALHRSTLGRQLARVEVRGAHAVAHERVDLVVHERDERRHHDAGALAEERGDLVAEALATARGHEHDRVAACRDVRDDLGLLAPERVVSEDRVQGLAGVGEPGGRNSGR